MTPAELIQAAEHAQSQGNHQRFRELCESILIEHPNTPEAGTARQLMDDESELRVKSNESTSTDTKQNLFNKARSLGAITSIALGVTGIIIGFGLIVAANEMMEDPLVLLVGGFIFAPIMYVGGIGIGIAGIALLVGGMSRLFRADDT